MEIDGLVLTDSVSGLIQQCISKSMAGKELTSATSRCDDYVSSTWTLTVFIIISIPQVSIIEYLDETRGPPYLLPRDNPAKRQQVMMCWAVYFVAHYTLCGEIAHR